MNAGNPGYSVMLPFVEADNHVTIFGVLRIEKIRLIEGYLNIVNSWFA